MMKLVQFGAGNIGRSFIGQLFNRAGWDVVFIDVNYTLVELINTKRFYNVIIKQEGQCDEVRHIGPVRALHIEQQNVINEELASADLIATSVGKGALTTIIPIIAKGLQVRYKNKPDWPLDIIIAENAPGASTLFREILIRELGTLYPLEELVGLVETSIGKMVPIMRSEDLVHDPLQLFAEAYETLILDKKAIKQNIQWPQSIELVDNISAFVARKLYIHNLGHASVAYTSFALHPEIIYIADAVRIDHVRERALTAMKESMEGLLAEFSNTFTRKDLEIHIQDLLYRFENRALGDTIYRVGRDLYRKLDKEDRLVGAMRLCAKHKLPYGTITQVYHSALQFSATDETGKPYPPDEEFRKKLSHQGVDYVLQFVSHLDPTDPIDQDVITRIKQ
jgi:mannitol-1-phosphate 5-dehydrogenase